MSSSHSKTACPAFYFYVLDGKNENWMLRSPLVDMFPYSTSSEILPNLLNFLQILSILISGRGADHQGQTKLWKLFFFLFYFHLNILCSFNLHVFAFVSKTGYDPLALLSFFFSSCEMTLLLLLVVVVFIFLFTYFY